MCETYTVVALSTGHLTLKDIEVLQQEADDPDEWMVMSREPGFFIKLYEGIDENLRHGHSEAIKSILRYAATQGFRMIEFDRDAELSAMFPTFDH